MKEKIVSKLLSGKFWLAMMAGSAFLYIVVSGKPLEGEVATIIAMVFFFYFNKNNNVKTS